MRAPGNPTQKDAMNWLNRLPGFQRSPHGLEWAIWKRLPAIAAWGTALPAAVALALLWATPDEAAADGSQLLVAYQLFGLALLHLTLVLTVAIGCVIVIIMKGRAYVADPYPPPEREAQDADRRA